MGKQRPPRQKKRTETQTPKITARLLERPRTERWWHGQDIIYPVPVYARPAIHDNLVAVLYEDCLYWVDANFDYTKVGEITLDAVPATTSEPRWFGAAKIAASVIDWDGSTRAVFVDTRHKASRSVVLSEGEPWRSGNLFEDRGAVAPLAANDRAVVVDCYGCLVDSSNRRGTIGEGVRIRSAPSLDSDGNIVTVVSTDDEVYVQWIDAERLAPLSRSRPLPSAWGITTGFVQSTPVIAPDNSVVVGLGDRLVRMYADGTVVWEFEYPEIDTADEEPGLTVMGGPGAKQVLEEIRSEVRICERPVITGENLFYVLSECTRHITYVVKAALHTGTVLWTSRIDGYSGDFNIVDASRRGLLIQQDRWLWAFAPDGTSVDKWECDVDGTSCSEFAPGRSGRYVMLSDLGLHAVDLDPYQSPIKRSAGRRPRRRSVFLSHASEDNEALVRPFYEECERRGISAWFDAAEIRWGDSIAAGVEQGLATARFVVLFVSRAFLSKPWPEKELSTALALEVAGRGVVLPILLGVTQAEIADRHPLLAEKLYRTLGDYDPSVPVSEGEIRKLVDALQERIR